MITRLAERTRTAVALTGAFAVVVAAGCMPDYNPSNFIEKYRVIGVMAEPPAVEFTPEYQGTVRLELVEAFPLPPTGDLVGPEIEGIEWSVCLISAGAAANFACTLPEIPVTDVSDSGRIATFDGALIALGLEFVRDQVEVLMDGIRQAVAFTDQCNKDLIVEYDDCLKDGDLETCNGNAFEGFRKCVFQNGLNPVFKVRVTVRDMLLDDSDLPVFDDDGKPVMRQRVLETFKTVTFGGLKEGQKPNRNPQFSVRLGAKPVDDLFDMMHPEGLVATTLGNHEQPEILACPGQEIVFQATVPPDSIDRVTGDDGVETDEYWVISWYANNGRFKKIRIGSVTAEGVDLDLTNTLKFKEEEPVRRTQVTLVMRDELFGLNFLRFFVEAQTRDKCPAPGTLDSLKKGDKP
ncbi:MAG TPA: hypothetical protein PLB35_07970 [Myxococcota bacterium]|nr:hypothetical protein [Myxococcota bacterium]HOA13336.1 hypothetical protein [Myxococcota bacterium]HOH77176.1 hypothetical protein [Myxococcota bacterium]HPV04281.1 hypothetical protein [Myxococcota bacterium]